VAGADQLGRREVPARGGVELVGSLAQDSSWTVTLVEFGRLDAVAVVVDRDG